MTQRPDLARFLLRTLATAALVVVASTACAAAPDPGAESSEDPCAPADAVVVLEGDALAVTLTESSTAEAFAAQLPMSVAMHDAMGQAFAGTVPTAPWPFDAAELVIDPEPGGVYYAPDADAVALYHADLTDVPPPGWVLLGTLTPAGLAHVASAPQDLDVQFDVAAGCGI